MSFKAILFFIFLTGSVAWAETDSIGELRASPKNTEKENEVNALRAEMLISKSEEQAIDQINKLLKKYKGTAMEPDLLFRLAELYMRRAKTDRFLEFHRHSDVVVQFAPKLVKAAQSKKTILLAIDLYDLIEKKYPRYERIDSVIFNNAFANQQISRQSKAEALYSKLIKQHNYSVLLADAYLALGEIQFEQRQFSSALKNFQAIRNYPDSMVYPYGLYKAAWTYYNLRDAEKGLKELEDVIKYGRFVKEKRIDSRLDLRKEALLDMALFYEDVRPAKNAYSYFAEQSAELDVSPVVLRLSKLYKRHSRHQDNKVILTEFIKRQPKSDYIPTGYVELMDSSEKMKKRNDVVVLLENLFDTCDPKSSWSKAQPQNIVQSPESPLREMNENKKPNATASEVCQSIFEKTAISYANKWHKMWLKTPAEEDLANSTEKAFALYLEKVPPTEDSGKARFVYADILFKRNKFRQASEQYARSVTITKDVKIGHDGRYFAILSLEKAVQDKWNDSDEKVFRTLAKDYLSTQVKGGFRLDVEFKMALIAYEKGRYDEAAPIFLRLGQQNPTLEKGVRAQDLYLDILNLQKNYMTLRDYAQNLRKSVKDSERGQKLTKIYEESYLLIIQEMETKGKTTEAIKEYKKFAQINPDSKLTQKCLWNAMQLLFKVDDLQGGAEAAVAYHNKYSGTKEGVDALKKAAQTYESMAQLKKAAAIVTTLAKVEPDQNEKWLNIAADFYLLDGAGKEARPIYEKISKSKDKDMAYRATVKLRDIAQQEGNTKQYELYLRELMNIGREPEASFGIYYFAQQDYDRKKFSEAFDQAKKVIALDKRGASKETLAKARLLQARILSAEFKSQSVKSKLNRLEMVLQLKTEKLQKAQIAYQSAAKYGDPNVAVSAYRELADCYLHYSEALKTMPVPMDLPENEVQAFRDEIAKLSMPMEEQGIETKMLALNAAREFHTGDAHAIQKEIGQMSPSTTSEVSHRALSPAIVLPKFEGVGT